jgi:hypothetical protein
MDITPMNLQTSDLDLDHNDIDQHRLEILGLAQFEHKYFIVASDWLLSWKIGKWAAGAIDQTSLYNSEGILRSGMQEGHDYFVVNE